MREHTLLQAFTWPDPTLDPNPLTYLRTSGAARWPSGSRAVQFAQGGQLRTDTYFNIFNYGKWARAAPLLDLALKLEGEGEFDCAICAVINGAEPITLQKHALSLTGASLLTLDLAPLANQQSALLFVQILCHSAEGQITAADWHTETAPRRQPKLAVCITTYQREAQVLKSVERFERFAKTSVCAPHLHLYVIDNGQSLRRPDSDKVTVIANENLGGSGGFARGFLQAEAQDATHCLFMDDDAATHMQAIERCWAFLAYARKTDVAIAGAVAQAAAPHRLWENGALFHMICRPAHQGLDLRRADQVLRLEAETTPRNPANFYGGWWFFAFSVAALRHMPFPFFVRGDDVSFSLAHDFDIITLPGVLSYQDEDFPVKESPLTVYLDLRSHLAHHLALPAMEIGRMGLAKIIARFWLRSLLACHYETLAAALLALEDVRAGPGHFAKTADLAQRRADIGALTQTERWTDRPTKSSVAMPRPASRPLRLLMKLSLNGHLLPGFTRFGKDITLPASQRGGRRPLWGARKITYISSDGQRAYSVAHDKRKALALSLGFAKAGCQLVLHYGRLKQDWRKGYGALTQRDFWRKRLGLRPAQTE